MDHDAEPIPNITRCSVPWERRSQSLQAMLFVNWYMCDSCHHSSTDDMSNAPNKALISHSNYEICYHISPACQWLKHTQDTLMNNELMERFSLQKKSFFCLVSNQKLPFGASRWITVLVRVGFTRESGRSPLGQNALNAWEFDFISSFILFRISSLCISDVFCVLKMRLLSLIINKW